MPGCEKELVKHDPLVPRERKSNPRVEEMIQRLSNLIEAKLIGVLFLSVSE